MPNSSDWKVEPPLPEVTCTSSDCESGLHCFRRVRPGKQSYRNGQCRDCEADLVEWERLDRNDLGDIEYTVEALELEFIRYVHWNFPIDQRAINYARRKGISGTQLTTGNQLRKLVGPPSSKLFRDGTQTPLLTNPRANAIHYAQHATATCCRKCIEIWHGIEREQPLTDKQLNYMTEFAMYYIRMRIPDLAQYGVKVPILRSSRSEEE